MLYNNKNFLNCFHDNSIRLDHLYIYIYIYIYIAGSIQIGNQFLRKWNMYYLDSFYLKQVLMR